MLKSYHFGGWFGGFLKSPQIKGPHHERVEEIRNSVEAGESKAGVAKSLGISRDTLYRYLVD
jgi:DNA invertase Pin-like site-specific DNA recombinase